MTGRPWWQRWDGLPESARRPRDAPLTSSQVLAARCLFFAYPIVSVGAAVLAGNAFVLPSMGVPLIVGWRALTPGQRAQLLSRGVRS